MSLVPSSSAIESGSYTLSRSLRFRSSASANLTRVYGTPTNRGIYTFSLWTKIAKLATGRMFFMVPGGSYTGFVLTDTDQLKFFNSTGAGNGTEFTTSAVYRDPSAWYHIVLIIDYTQSVGSQVKFYVNGVQQTVNITGTGTAITQTNTRLNTSGNTVYWGTNGGGGEYYDGYFADAYFIDGQALTPSSFGQTDATTGVWVPKKYTGTYGTNGFYLPFTNTTSATTLCYDSSGNGNNWTPNNISTTAGVTYDSMTDVPTLTSATAANFCAINPVDSSSNAGTITNGNLTTVLTGDTAARGTIALPSSGKWYWEVTVVTAQNRGSSGICSVATPVSTLQLNVDYRIIYFWWNGEVRNGATTIGTYSTLTTGDVLNVAVDMDAGKVYFGKNNTWQNSGNPAAGTGYITTTTAGITYAPMAVETGTPSTVAYNFGQQGFKYTPPTGFKALNTFNLPDPTIKKPNQYMDATTYTGTGSSLTVSNGNFQPDLVWAKCRNIGHNNVWQDSARGFGSGKNISSNQTQAEGVDNDGYMTGVTSTGFTVAAGNGTNANGNTYIGWQWKESATAGFDIVTYTGTGSARTVSHNLGVAPSWMIVKARNVGSTNWFIYTATQGNTKYLDFTTGTGGTDSSAWNNTSPTSSVFTVGSSYYTNWSGTTYVAYLFSEIPGFSKFGSYTGNGSTDGPFVYCGFRPKYVMVKDTSTSAYDWFVYDSVRNTYNPESLRLNPNTSNAEFDASAAYPIDFCANGYKIRGTNGTANANGSTYIYAAFAENPFKYANAR